ncbi:MAG: helix-turn-helix domain-containing protein, partial [Acidimicrobiales bacterium]
MLLPAWCLPRRRDAAEVVLKALRAKADGDGHRRIAERLGRPPGTVRGWLRRATQLTEELRTMATRWAYALDAELSPI